MSNPVALIAAVAYAGLCIGFLTKRLQASRLGSALMAAIVTLAMLGVAWPKSEPKPAPAERQCIVIDMRSKPAPAGARPPQAPGI